MMMEERMIYGGNSSVALGTTPTPTLVAGARRAARSRRHVQGRLRGAHARWLDARHGRRRRRADDRPHQRRRTTDTINGGTAQQSATASITLSAGTAVQAIKASVTPVTGAVAYAWFMGPDTTHAYLSQITTINSALITATPANTFQNVFSLTAADYSKDNTYSFDGLLYAGPFSGNGGYLASQATGTQGTGTPLTSDSAGGITEINTALKWFYDNYRLSPDTIWCNSQEIQNISAKIIAGGAAPLFRFNLDATGNVAIIAGAVVGQYLNKFTGQLLKVRIHPFAVPGTILFTTKTLPYPQSGVNTVAQIKCRKEYYMIEWPLRTRKYEYGCYVDEVLQLQFLPGSARSRTSANG
jgi:hypothetical protein